ncbi:hypothetical protein BGW36DRAFT_412471 [Talaromyces proteolyticus]|uniref:ABM domain-containing protein n=1 Tax=Talaromyces proteolyticus TaxID=1131652 RepID=A0AAD4KCW4_9EURO|nr:uncharacterized protein BGW36DRAFT_412471 [Talaromyces proteolyticus]KAH8688959.1 hypothetical protein BGW36DRAFT_412471 [Talaromyces proteolyticus]
MSAGGAANGVILLQPQEGKKNELEQYLSKNLTDIRENVPGVLIAFHFWAEEKNQFVVVESFESTAAMFEYGNSMYHEGLVSKVVDLAITPIEALSDQDTSQELKDFRKTSQAVHFNF